MIDIRFHRFVNYRRSLPQRQRELLDALTRRLLAAGPAAPLSSARETWWRWIQRALPRCTPAQCKAMATYAMAAFASGIIRPGSINVVSLQSAGQPIGSMSQLSAIQNELQNSLDSDNEISEMGSMQLQMLMDARSKLLQTASDVEKTWSDTVSAITQNTKQ